MELPDVRNVAVKGKRVFLRMDLDAPLTQQSIINNQQSTVADDTRLVVGMPTLEYLLANGASVVVGGHLRRPEGYDPKFSVKPVVEWIFQKIKDQKSNIKNENGKLGEFDGWRLAENLFVLENLRFYKEEKANGEEFAKRLASLADLYVNDAFASSHRAHASIVGIPKFLPHFVGFHLKKEIVVLSKILENPARPLVVIIGGEKIETKLPLVSKMCHIADNILVGGKIAKEILNQDELKKRNKDIRCSFLIGKINSEGTDVTKESVLDFIEMVNIGKTVVWNGPIGFIEDPTGEGRKGSESLAEAIAKCRAYTVVGGGDTLEFLKKMNLLQKVSFFSTGGGAMLSFLSGEKLPGIEALI